MVVVIGLRPSREMMAAPDFPGAGLGGSYGDPGAPSHQDPLLVLLAGSDGKANRYGQCQCGCRSCRKV